MSQGTANGWTLLIQRPGMATRRFRLPAWLLVALPASLCAVLLTSGFWAYQRQALSITGISAVSLERDAGRKQQRRTLRSMDWFGVRRERPTQEQSHRATLERAKRLGLGTKRAAGFLLSGRVEHEWLDAAGGTARTPGNLLWPVDQGWFVRGYGSGEGGYHLAMDIMGERGSDVLAAADGIVGYEGEGVRGYGRIVIVVHAGGWVTMYAHNDSNYVMPGQRVSRGDPIASLGNTGISRGPHVHFEFMHRGRNCDPAPLFQPGVRHRWGGISHLVPTGWMEPDARPRSVACDRRRRHPRSRYGDPATLGDMDLSASL